jgi:aminomethyltransferase
MEAENLKRTPLFELHRSSGAKMVPFAGWEMPVQYSGVIPEHRGVRGGVGLFDVSHMGEILVTGPSAFELLNYLTCNDLSKVAVGRAQYSALTTETGGIVDDIIVYRLAEQEYFLCVNASNCDRDYEWLCEHNSVGASVINQSSDFAQIAVQGPLALTLMERLEGVGTLGDLRSFSFKRVMSDFGELMIARTGYTGEDGVEIFVAPQSSVALWSALLELGVDLKVIPVGLGARDTLRLEACLPLHGHELSTEITAVESGLGWIVKPAKGDFLGRDILARELSEGAQRSLVGFFVDGVGIAREGDTVFSQTGAQIGKVTSGTKTPTLDRALGLALVESQYSIEETPLVIEVRGRQLQAHTTKRPFYRRSSNG